MDLSISLRKEERMLSRKNYIYIFCVLIYFLPLMLFFYDDFLCSVRHLIIIVGKLFVFFIFFLFVLLYLEILSVHSLHLAYFFFMDFVIFMYLDLFGCS
jgi:hypothetical protein